MVHVFCVTPCCFVGDFRRSEEYDVSAFTDSRFLLRPSTFGPQDKCVPADRNTLERRGRLFLSLFNDSSSNALVVTLSSEHAGDCD